MTVLHVADNLDLPEAFATEGVLVTGMRGSGKSNTEVRFAEVLYAAGIPFVAVDPKGDWYGLRSSSDGKRPGLPIPVFGGAHGDFPLEASNGKIVADLLVDNTLSAVLDVSLLPKTTGRATFLVAFFDQLMRRHHLDPHARTVILEEAHSYIPQQVPASLARLKEAAAAILLEGRAFGLGCWAATQRPARLNKDVVEEVGTAVIHRIGVGATNDKKTLTGWVKHYELGDEIVDSLTSLKAGEAWVIAPEYGLVARVRFDRRQTFDSGATPEVGMSKRQPRTLADIDHTAITAAMADTIERAREDDPKELRRRVAERDRTIAELRRQLGEHEHEPEIVEVEVPVLDDDLVARLESALGEAARVGDFILDTRTQVLEALAAARSQPAPELDRRPGGDPHARVPQQHRPAPVAPSPRTPTRAATAPDTGLSRAERAILTVLAQHPPGRPRTVLAFLSGYSAKSSSFANALGALRSKDLVEKGGEPIRATGEGLNALPDIEPLPTGAELLDHWRARLGKAERTILDVIVAAWPDEIDRQELADRSGYSATSSSYANALGRLRSLEMVTGCRLSDALADAIEEALNA